MLPSIRAATAALAVVALGVLAACGESPVSPTATDAGAPTARPAPTASSAAARTVHGCDGATLLLSAEEMRTLDLHNATRRALGLDEFCADSLLTVAARAHSEEMLAKGYFSHDSFDGETFDARIRALGYPAHRALAENVAWGTDWMGEADDVYGRWMASETHRHNIVDGTLRRIGVGVAGGTYGGRSDARMYTVDFGSP
jgi:uncharacterized protein YkwD